MSSGDYIIPAFIGTVVSFCITSKMLYRKMFIC